jgi:hypothetical protein
MISVAFVGGTLFILITVVLFFLVFSEKREYPNTAARESVDFLTSIFDNNRTLMPKIEDFDNFKYSGYDIKSPMFTYTSDQQSSNPYNKVASANINLDATLNSTIVAEDKAVAAVEAALPVNESNNDIEDTTASLTGINGNTEAAIRESMVKSELRRIRR